MTTLSTVSTIVFYVKDLTRTAAFYRDALGLALEVLDGHDGERFAIAGTATPTLVFLEHDEPPGRTPVVVFGLAGGIDEVVEGLARQGVEIVTPVSEAPDGGLTADFADPDGHILSVHQPPGLPRRAGPASKAS